MVSTAKSNGMKVILDWVANHTAWDCPLDHGVAVNTTGEFQKDRTTIVLAGSTMKNIPDGSSVNIPYEIELAPYSYTIMMN